MILHDTILYYIIPDALQESSFDLIAGLLREDVGILEDDTCTDDGG